jgi:hypothetical protein
MSPEGARLLCCGIDPEIDRFDNQRTDLPLTDAEFSAKKAELLSRL